VRPPSITIRELTKVFRQHRKQQVVANDHLSLEIYSGEIFGLLGPNGAGKTTLVLQLLGLTRPTSGSIYVENIDVLKHPNQVKSIAGFLPQSGVPMRTVSVEQALRYTGCLRGQPEREARQQARQLIERLGLVDQARQDVHTLSGGQMRLVNFGMALMGKPRLLILDEPTNELDPENRRLVWDMLHELNDEARVTCILVTHNVLEAERVVHRVGIMNKGQFVAVGSPGAIKGRYSSLIRIEISLKDGVAQPLPAGLAGLSSLGSLEQTRNGYRLYLPSEQVSTGVDIILNQIGPDYIDDFKVAPPSLEDAYLALECDE
jgi:ABC-type multidrug transport system ATPase subunit